MLIRGYLVDRWFLNPMEFWRQTGCQTNDFLGLLDGCKMIGPEVQKSLPGRPATGPRSNRLVVSCRVRSEGEGDPRRGSSPRVDFIPLHQVARGYFDLRRPERSDSGPGR